MIWRLALLAMLAWALGFAAFGIALPGPADGQVSDAVVVVTGGPGRIQRGLQLIQAGKAKRMLIAGVDRRVKPHELAIQYRVPQALIAARVDLGHESVDTRSNADEIATWVRQRGYTSVRLVTTDWHMRRTRFELARVLGPDVSVLADAVPSEPDLWVLATEYNKYLLRRVAGPLGI